LQSSKNIRNFGIIAHIDAGKTTTTERILYLSGSTYKIGEVDDGTTITDWMLEEKEHGITITSAAVSCLWNNSMFHLIDTPGHVDFTAEVQRSLRVLDGAVVVFCGVSGVQTQSETVWKQADKYNIPRIVFINKLDRLGANFDFVIKDIKKKLKAVTLPVTIPLYKNDNLKEIINLITMKKLSFKEDGNINEIVGLTNDETKYAEKYKEEMINTLTNFDDKILELALSDCLKEEDLIKAIRKGAIERKFIPVFAGSSLKNIGIPPLLDAIEHYLPSPDDIGFINGFNSKKEIWEKILFKSDSDLVAYIFKVQFSREKGIIAFLRVYSGKFKNGDSLFNPRTKKRERVQDLLKVFADKFERIDHVSAGDIVTVSGLKDVKTGDTLCRENYQVLLENITFPEPVIFMTIETKNALEKEKLNTAIDAFLLEDPTIVFKEDKDTGQTLIGGMGELHIQIILERMKNQYKLDLRCGHPQVAYKETPKNSTSYTYVFNQKIEGNIQHVTLTLEITPDERTKGNLIKNELDKKQSDIFSSIEKGITNGLNSGPEGAYPVTDSVITIKDIEYDQSKTSPVAVEACANICTGYLLREAKTILLEPIMKLEISTPVEFTGTIIGDLQSRNGIILNVHKTGDVDVIIAKASLKVMFGYTTSLRSLSQGKATFTMEFLLYDEG